MPPSTSTASPSRKLVKDESGKVIGIFAGEDEITADVVVLCDGANSLLAEQAVGAARPSAAQMAVGIKQVYELPEEIEKRFQCNPGEGTAWLFAGDATHGTFGGGIIYTNKDSISLGIVAGIEATMNQGKTPCVSDARGFEESSRGGSCAQGRQAGRAFWPHGSRRRYHHDA